MIQQVVFLVFVNIDALFPAHSPPGELRETARDRGGAGGRSNGRYQVRIY